MIKLTRYKFNKNIDQGKERRRKETNFKLKLNFNTQKKVSCDLLEERTEHHHYNQNYSGIKRIFRYSIEKFSNFSLKKSRATESLSCVTFTSSAVVIATVVVD